MTGAYDPKLRIVVLMGEYAMPARMTNAEPLRFDDPSPDHMGDVGDYTGDTNR